MFNINSDQLANTLFDKRYKILGLLFFILVLLDINFSSIHMWNKLVFNFNHAFIIGKARGVRSDEWAVNLPLQMSQVYNHFATYNHLPRYSGLNTIIAQFQAGWNIENIGRPINWGFLFLGKSRGLSWYWSLKLILLFLSSIEFIFLLTQNKKLALTGAYIITYAPGVQWWFSNYIPELITSFQFIIVFLALMLKTHDFRIKFLYTIGLTIFSIGFVFVIYPPWQIPLLYLILAFIFIIFRQNKIIKIDLILCSIVLLINIICLIHFYWISHSDISLMANTVFPGHRRSQSGGVNIVGLMDYLNNIFTPFMDPNYLNSCELSNFWIMFPVLPFICFIIPSKNRETYFNLILYYNIFLIIFMLIPNLATDYIYNITLFSYVTGHRLLIISGLLNTYLLLLFIAKFNSKSKAYCVINIFTWLYVSIWLFGSNIYQSMHLYLYLSIFLACIIIHLILINHKKFAIMLLLLLTFVTGQTINPITFGTGDLYNSKLSHTISEIRKQDPTAIWVSVGPNSSLMGEYILSQGLYSFNNTKFYPDFKVWNKLDKEHKYIDIYNRYSYVNMNLVNEGTSFQLLQADLIILNLNNSDLIKNTDIKYILSNQPISLNNKIKLIDTIDGKYIYKIIR